MQSSHPATEARHPGTVNIDELSTLDFVRLMNAEDARVAVAIATESDAIAEAIDRITERMKRGGRLVYVGAGTSGRLGVLDAAECPATFSTQPGQVVAIIAGGVEAITGASEDAEDDEAGGGAEIRALEITSLDTVVGISASGRTPFVVGALTVAQERGALIVSIAGNRPSPLERLAEVAIAPIVGPEILTGSTRLKAGTAQKMVLNMLSTGVMVRLGKTYGNLMVDINPTSAKLRDRARRIVEAATGCSSDAAQTLLDAAAGDVKVAVVASVANITPNEARSDLLAAGGVIRDALARRRDGPGASDGSSTLQRP